VSSVEGRSGFLYRFTDSVLPPGLDFSACPPLRVGRQMVAVPRLAFDVRRERRGDAVRPPVLEFSDCPPLRLVIGHILWKH